MRACLVVLSLLAVLASTSFAVAGEPPVPIEGKLVMAYTDSVGTPIGGSYVTGMSDSEPIPLLGAAGTSPMDISPLGDRILYNVITSCDPVRKVCLAMEVRVVGLDGSGDVSLTAGLGGGNQCPRWSPDGSMVAFWHSEPLPGQQVCEALAGQLWVMNADGTGGRAIPTPGMAWVVPSDWAPDGHGLLLCGPGDGFCAATVNLEGTELRGIPGVAGRPRYSPDGARVAYTGLEDGTKDDKPGVWHELRVADADGSSPQVVFREFLGWGEIEDHLALYPDNWDPAQHDAESFGISIAFGPLLQNWSPNGDRIAFESLWPWDPAGLRWRDQTKVWILDVSGGSPGDRTELTGQHPRVAWLSWRGDNTSNAHPQVTVNNTTVAFSSVTGDGLTTIIRDDDPPAMPTGYQFCGEYYEINTTLPDGSYSLPITVTMTYKDEDVPGGDEGALVLLHYNEMTQQWEDITTERNTDENWVKGETQSLSVFGLGLRLPLWVSPLRNDTSEGSSAGPFKRGRTIPVKFRLYGADGQLLSDADAAALHPQLQVFYERASAEGAPVETGESLPDVGAEFRYDAAEDLFIYNLSTKDPAWLANYTYGLQVLIDGAKAGEVFFSLR